MNAHTISQVVSEHPVSCSYQSERFAAQLSRLSPGTGAESRMLYDQSGREVVSHEADPTGLAVPLLRREAPINDAGHQVGRVVVALSLYGLLLDTAYLMAIIAIIVGALCLILHCGPLRQLQRAWERTFFLVSRNSLTSLPNRETFLDRLDRQVQKAGWRATIMTMAAASPSFISILSGSRTLTTASAMPQATDCSSRWRLGCANAFAEMTSWPG